MFFQNIHEFIQFTNGERTEYYDYMLKINIVNYTFKLGDYYYRIEKKKQFRIIKNESLTSAQFTNFESDYGTYGTWEKLEPQLVKLEPDAFKHILRKQKIKKLLKNDTKTRKN